MLTIEVSAQNRREIRRIESNATKHIKMPKTEYYSELDSGAYVSHRRIKISMIAQVTGLRQYDPYLIHPVHPHIH